MSKSRTYLDHLRRMLAGTATPFGRGKNTVAIVGVRSDANSSFVRGPADAPLRIRDALYSESSNMATEGGKDIIIRPVEDHFENDKLGKLLNDEQEGRSRAAYNVIDLGDMEFSEGEDSDPEIFVERLVELCSIINARNIAPIFLGGDHAVTYPLFLGLATTARRHMGHGDAGDSVGGEWVEPGDRDVEKPYIIHFDAHPDMYPDFEGNPMSHASPFARILEAGLCQKLTQLGIRCGNQKQNDFMKEFSNVDQVTMDQLHFLTPQELTDYIVKASPRQTHQASNKARLYLSIDIDCLDPAYAPGVSHHEPGGLTTRQLLHMVQSVPHSTLMAADIVEYNPARDRDGFVTARVAAKLFKELVPKLSRRDGAPQHVDVKQKPAKGVPWPWKRTD